MTTIGRYTILIAIATTLLPAQVRVSGTVRLVDGGNLPSGVAVQITEIVPLQDRTGFPGDGSDSFLPTRTPFISVADVDTEGRFIFDGVPAADYIVCAYGDAPGLVSNCEWNPNYTMVTAREPLADVPTIEMTMGRIITFTVQDADRMLGDFQESAGKRQLPNAHYFQAGVISDQGYFAAARLISATRASRAYSVTVPKGLPLWCLVDSDLALTDLAGSPVQTRRRARAIPADSVDATVELSVH